jgi:leucyl/phenylalanyl-tRNA--protein transferase
MPHICFDERNFYFPDVEEADEEGLVLIGGQVTPARVLEAYKKGIFPWYNDEALPLWWSPDPRFVLFPEELHVSKSMQKMLGNPVFEFKINQAFEDVIHECATVKRKEQSGTWLTQRMKEVYIALHHQGYAHSAEAWKDGTLVGGMYGLQLGQVFFGESMFSKEKNASKYAFIKFVQNFNDNKIRLLDCQVYTTHVESLGARLIDRQSYLAFLERLVHDSGIE